jgi:hypothetical protein
MNRKKVLTLLFFFLIFCFARFLFSEFNKSFILINQEMKIKNKVTNKMNSNKQKQTI